MPVSIRTSFFLSLGLWLWGAPLIGLGATAPGAAPDGTVPSGAAATAPGETAILGGLLAARLPVGARPISMRPGIMAAEPAATSLNGFELGPVGTGRLLLFAQNLWSLTGPSLAALLARVPELSQFPGRKLEPVEVADPRLQVIAFNPTPGSSGVGDSEVASYFVRLPDGIFVRLRFNVTGGGRGPWAAELPAAAWIVSTLRAGPRRPDLGACLRRLGVGTATVSVKTPAGYFASVDDGDDFILAHLQPVAEFDRVDHSEIHVYLGSHPQRLSPASKTVAGTLLGRPVAWREDAPFKGILQQRCQQPLPDGRGTLDVFVDGPSKERIAALQAIAETLAVP